ncbi:MAG: TolC family protein [Planctomycetota bacterium]
MRQLSWNNLGPTGILCGFVLVYALCDGALSSAQDAPPPTTLDANSDVDSDAAVTGAETDDTRIEIRLAMDEAIAIAIERNLDLRVEHIRRENSARDVVIARASFDPLFTTQYTVAKFRQPTISFLSGVGSLSSVRVNPFESQTASLGISGLLPTGLTYNLTATDERNDSPDSSFVAFNPSHTATLEARLTQPLLKGSGFASNLADLRVAHNNYSISHLQLERMLETTVASVRNAYWDLVFADEDLRVKREALREAEQLLEINRQRVRVGTATEIDVFDAEANIETQRGGIIDAENLQRRTQDSLLDLLNYSELLVERGLAEAGELAPYERVRVVAVTPLAFHPYDVDVNDAVGLALANRQDLRESELAIDNAELELLRRRNQALPGLNLSGSWRQQGLDGNLGAATDSVGRGRFYDWDIGITFEYPIGNRQERYRFAKAKDDVATSRLNLLKLTNTITLEVTQAARDIRSSVQKLQSTRAAVRLRREQLEGEKERLRVGSSTSYQVLQIQNDLLEAQSLELQSLVDYERAITAFETAVGVILGSVGVTIQD